jgi:hypothetical protein
MAVSLLEDIFEEVLTPPAPNDQLLYRLRDELLSQPLLLVQRDVEVFPCPSTRRKRGGT